MAIHFVPMHTVEAVEELLHELLVLLSVAVSPRFCLSVLPGSL